MNKQLIYAIKDGEIKSILDVESGLACGCVCPACGSTVIAKKGTQRTPHFAHYNVDACTHGYQTSLHLAAKDIIQKAEKFMLPAVYVNFPHTDRENLLAQKPMEIKVDKVVLEKRYDDIIPDVIIYSGEEKYFVEIFVSHAVDDTKLEKLKNAGVSTIEIDLSKENRLIKIDELEDLLLKSDKKKEWKYSKLSEDFHKRFIDASEKKKVIQRGVAQHVDGCLIPARTWNGKAYANIIDDCLYCDYCVAIEDYVYCTRKELISRVADFSFTKEERIAKFEQERIKKLEEHRTSCFLRRICPECGYRIIARKNGEDTVYTCRGENCTFSAFVDGSTGELIWGPHPSQQILTTV